MWGLKSNHRCYPPEQNIKCELCVWSDGGVGHNTFCALTTTCSLLSGGAALTTTSWTLYLRPSCKSSPLEHHMPNGIVEQPEQNSLSHWENSLDFPWASSSWLFGIAYRLWVVIWLLFQGVLLGYLPWTPGHSSNDLQPLKKYNSRWVRSCRSLSIATCLRHGSPGCSWKSPNTFQTCETQRIK